jgi:hypothetical protein
MIYGQLNGAATSPPVLTAIAPAPTPRSLNSPHDLVSGGLLNVFAGMGHAAGNVVSQYVTDEIFSLAGAGHRAGAVPGVSARANQGAVSDAAKRLVGVSACEGGVPAGGRYAGFDRNESDLE